MKKRLGVVMDPIATIQYKKDSTLAMLWEAQARDYDIYYFEQKDLVVRDGIPYGNAKILNVMQDPSKWYSFQGEVNVPLADLSVILMRKDPPFNQEYIYTTYILEHAERLGVFVVNRPQALRDSNEKMFTTFFPDCMPRTLVTQSVAALHAFLQEQEDIVCKPLDSMGGVSVFRLRKDDVNLNVVFESLTRNGTLYIMAQKYIPEITKGDRRILMLNGEPVSHVLVRVPQDNDWRGNLAVGAKGVVEPLSKSDRKICDRVGPILQERGLYFAGLDVIGNYLTEINVTSPTGIREIDAGAKMNVSKSIFDMIEAYTSD